MFDDTKLSRAGTDSDGNAGILNPPVYRASTIHFPTIEAFDTRFERRFDDASTAIAREDAHLERQLFRRHDRTASRAAAAMRC